MRYLGTWEVEDVELTRPDGESWQAWLKGRIYLEDGFEVEDLEVSNEDGEALDDDLLTATERQQAEAALAESAWDACYVAGTIPAGTWRHKRLGTTVEVLDVVKVPGHLQWNVLIGPPPTQGLTSRSGRVRYRLFDRESFEDGLCGEAEYELVEAKTHE